MSADDKMIDQKASDSLSVAPDGDEPGAIERGAGGMREAQDAESVQRLKRDPSDEDAKLDVALDETFPGSDTPSNTQPGKGKDPAPSTGYDADAEAARRGG